VSVSTIYRIEATNHKCKPDTVARLLIALNTVKKVENFREIADDEVFPEDYFE